MRKASFLVTAGIVALSLGSAAGQGVLAPTPAVKQATVNGADLVYVDQGKGAPVVFVTARLPITAPGRASEKRSRSSTGISH